jgi:outer membrane protein
MKQFLYKIILGIFVMQLFAEANGQLPQIFNSLEDLWNWADKNNIQIITAVAQSRITENEVMQSWGNLMPSLSLNGGFTDNIRIQPTLVPADLFGGPKGVYREEQFGRTYLFNTGLLAQLNLVNLQDWFAIRAARYNDEIARLNILKTKREAYEKIADSYYSYLLQHELVTLSLANLHSCDSILQVSQYKFQQGQISEISMNTAYINREKAEKNMEASSENARISLSSLKLLLGLGMKDSLAVNEDYGPLKMFVENGEFPADPSTEISAFQLSLSQNNLNAARASFAPTISAIYQWNGIKASDAFLTFANASNLPQEFWGLRLTFPIFTGFTRAFQVQKTRIELENQQKIYNSVKDQSDINDQTLRLEFHKASNALIKATEILNLYKKNDLHAARKLNEGLISLDERLRVYADYVANQNEFMQDLSEYFFQYYRIQIRKKNIQP